MKKVQIDGNSRSLQISAFGFSKDFSSGVVDDPEVRGFIRLKNIGDELGRVRYEGQDNSDGVVFSPGETEYFSIDDDKRLEILSGTFNIMY